MENYEEITIEKKNSFAENHPVLFLACFGAAVIGGSVAACVGGYYLVGKVMGRSFKKEVMKK